MANVLPTAKRVQILNLLCEGTSMRAASRIADVSINTVTKLLEQAGEACLALHDELVRGVKAERVQADELWSFCYVKAKTLPQAKAAPAGAGDAWTWTAIDADSKLMVSYFVGDRTPQSAQILMEDLAARLSNERPQITTDGNFQYNNAIDLAFGGEAHYGQIIKHYGTVQEGPNTRYSPPACIGAKKGVVQGEPDEAHISTSYVERANLSIRMQNRRFTRLTNAFSKKFANHVHMLALYFAFYNFVRIHKSLRMTPAMKAGIVDKLWSLGDVVARIDAAAPKPGPRGPYKTKSKA